MIKDQFRFIIYFIFSSRMKRNQTPPPEKIFLPTESEFKEHFHRVIIKLIGAALKVSRMLKVVTVGNFDQEGRQLPTRLQLTHPFLEAKKVAKGGGNAGGGWRKNIERKKENGRPLWTTCLDQLKPDQVWFIERFELIAASLKRPVPNPLRFPSPPSSKAQLPENLRLLASGHLENPLSLRIHPCTSYLPSILWSMLDNRDDIRRIHENHDAKYIYIYIS